MGIRNGKQYIEGLKKQPREVWLSGKRVEDVTTHPNLKGSVETIANLYDLQHQEEFKHIMTYTSPSSGEPVGLSFLPPQSYEDLVVRRKMMQVWANSTFGLMGRSPDFLNVTITAFYEARDFFAKFDQKYANNITKYYEYVRENDLFLTHALIDPQVDRSKPASQQEDPYTCLGIVRETTEGIIVRGAKMLATLAPVTDELIIYNVWKLNEGEEKYALAFAIPVSTQGLKFLCREPLDLGRSSYDHPLGSRFEEMDAICVFEDVLIPWERVFMAGELEMNNRFYSETNLRNHSGHQTAVRAVAKAEFATAVAMSIAETIGIQQFLHVQEKLGEMIGYTELMNGALLASEIQFEKTVFNTVMPAFNPLQATRTQFPKMYVRMIEIIQLLGAGGLMASPTQSDVESEQIGHLIAKYYKGANVEAKDRVQLFKLAWDLAGDGFGQRTLLYERYYAGDPVRITASHYLGYNRKPELIQRVKDFMKQDAL
ncbi:4-hydroxyphenylacetate 3-monooxygenase, oxygenase component [Paenibacillus frigoriresistens]|uniref:4-hydroxyphenylacetate 3-monooxygenase, oxygenase component n=1 Tax=Paenibacillus alginolyticus TaxID=59839 RepID=UPI00156365CD|nr:4-hydroxyphenylacetate 3-monooxygenase, oxygenase component [Paenibacillus frigoriresistens]NRF94374.1 4-hydroxyphenylacetate 3-monooxygenase, oxygenase component [Paenibacillus frigoriresistens]